MITNQELTLLLVEDSVEDYTAMQRIITKIDTKIVLHRTESAEEALDFLLHKGAYSASNGQSLRVPALIFLDLNLPGMDGRELLRQLKKDEQLKLIPIIVMTTSSNPRDVQECYRFGANSYQIKSVNYKKFSESILQLFLYCRSYALTTGLNSGFK